MKNIADNVLSTIRREIPFAHAMILFCVSDCKCRLGLKTYEEVLDVSDLYRDFESRFAHTIGFISNGLK